MNNLFQVICRIGIFMICAQAIVHFRPEESYEKYLKLLVSAMVLIQLFLPLGRFLFHGGNEELAIQSQAFLDRLEAEILAAEKEAYDTDALLERMTLEEVRRRMEEAQAAQGEEAMTGREDGNNITGAGGIQEGGFTTQGDESVTPEPDIWNPQGNGSVTPEPGIWNSQGAGAADQREQEDDAGAVRIERIQVDEIRVRLPEASP